MGRGKGELGRGRGQGEWGRGKREGVDSSQARIQNHSSSFKFKDLNVFT